jgi:hypothetical protein
MTAAFTYRPKFVDIRVNKPDPANAARNAGERACDHVGCQRAGGHKAPKARHVAPTGDESYWWFCAEHAGEYNRRWDFFAGMNEAELKAYAEAELAGHRPTWSFKASRQDREAAARKKFHAWRGEQGAGLFGGKAAASAPRLTRLQALAMAALGLEENATPEEVRNRYASLVKRYHPDSNGGDRSAETDLHRVIRAYQTLKQAGLA